MPILFPPSTGGAAALVVSVGDNRDPSAMTVNGVSEGSVAVNFTGYGGSFYTDAQTVTITNSDPLGNQEAKVYLDGCTTCNLPLMMTGASLLIDAFPGTSFRIPEGLYALEVTNSAITGFGSTNWNAVFSSLFGVTITDAALTQGEIDTFFAAVLEAPSLQTGFSVNFSGGTSARPTRDQPGAPATATLGISSPAQGDSFTIPSQGLGDAFTLWLSVDGDTTGEPGSGFRAPIAVSAGYSNSDVATAIAATLAGMPAANWSFNTISGVLTNGAVGDQSAYGTYAATGGFSLSSTAYGHVAYNSGEQRIRDNGGTSTTN